MGLAKYLGECPHCGGEGMVVSGAWLRQQRLAAKTTLAEMSARICAAGQRCNPTFLSNIECGTQKPVPHVVAAYERLLEEQQPA